MFKCPLGDCVSSENNTYVGLTATLSRRLTMHLKDFSSIALHLKTHSIPNSIFQKILVENNTINHTKLISYDFKSYKPDMYKQKDLESIELILKLATILKCLWILLFRYSPFLDNIPLPLITFCSSNSSASQFFSNLRLRNFVLL